MGGVEKRTLRLIKAILDNNSNISIDLMLNQKKGELLNSADDRVALYSIGFRNTNFLSSFIRLKKLINNTAPDIIVAGLGQLSIITVIAKLIFKFKSKIILIQALPIYLANASLQVNIKRILGARIFYLHLDKIVTVSKGVESSVNEISGKLNKKTVTIYNPVIEPDILSKADEENHHPFFNNNVQVIISVGRLTKEKDHETLIKAFALVKKDISREVKLIILGDGDKRPSLEKLIHKLSLTEDVSLPGFADNPYSYMKRSSVFVLSSLWEGFGNVLVEAMALGVPVVSTNCESGPDEILENGKIGELVLVRDEVAMSKAIIKQLKAPDKPEILIKRASDFTVEKAAAEYIRVFSSLSL